MLSRAFPSLVSVLVSVLSRAFPSFALVSVLEDGPEGEGYLRIQLVIESSVAQDGVSVRGADPCEGCRGCGRVCVSRIGGRRGAFAST